MWWDWVKTSRDLEAMTWEEFHELFMGKFFPTSARHAKDREFLELKQGTMTMLEYMAKFIELARFADDYVGTNMAKVRKFEYGLELSIWGKIVGLLLHDLDSMVRTAIVIEKEVDDAQNIRDVGVKDKKRETQPSFSNSGKRQRSSTPQGFQGQGHSYQAKARFDHPKVGDISRHLAS